jgi:hypothetical protein
MPSLNVRVLPIDYLTRVPLPGLRLNLVMAATEPTHILPELSDCNQLPASLAIPVNVVSLYSMSLDITTASMSLDITTAIFIYLAMMTNITHIDWKK